MSLINDALKKAQQKRAEDAAAQPPAPPAPAVPDTISQPHPDDLKAQTPKPAPKLALPPPPPNRPQLPIPPAPPAAPRRPGPPIVNYSIPQVESAEQPATGSTKPRVSSIRYRAGGDDDDTAREPRSGGQKIFWISVGAIAAIALVVRLAVTLGRDDETASGHPQAEPNLPPQAAVAPVTPSLPPPPPIPPPTASTVQLPTASAEPAPEPAAPATPPPTPEPAPIAPAPVAAAPATPAPAAPTITFPGPANTQPATRPTQPAPSVTPPVAAVPKPAATAEAAPPPAKPAPTVLPPIYAPRAPTPVNNSVRIQNFIDRLRVSMVRINEKGSKVVLNDRLFTVGEIVDPGLELKLVKIEPGLITFTDSGGKKYIKLYQ